MSDRLEQLQALLEQLSVEELMTAWARAGRHLRSRGAVRSSNVVGDLSEWIGADRLNLQLLESSERSIDALGPDGTSYQVKGRWLTPENRSRELSAIRGPFDLLLAVFFDVDMRLSELWTVPHAVVEANSKFVPRTNALKFSVNRKVQAHPQVVRLL